MRNRLTPPVSAWRRCHPPLSLNPRIVSRQRALLLSSRPKDGGTRGTATQGGACESESARGRLYPRSTVPGRPLWPAGHLPHYVGENVGEPRSHLHPDCDHRQDPESRPHYEIRRVNPTTNRGLRLRGGKTTPNWIMEHNRRHTSHWDIPAYPPGLPRMTSERGSSRAAGADRPCRTATMRALPVSAR